MRRAFSGLLKALLQPSSPAQALTSLIADPTGPSTPPWAGLRYRAALPSDAGAHLLRACRCRQRRSRSDRSAAPPFASHPRHRPRSGLRLGWLVLPEPLVAEAKATKRLLDDFSPTLEQFAFTRMLARGDYQRQIRRARAVYRGRRDRMTQALAKRLPELAVSGVAAGLHVLLELPVQSDDREIEAASRGAGIALEAAHPLHAHRSRATWAAPGLRAAA